MKSNSYMDRALKARDPRYARILSKLGYERRDMVAAPAPAPVVVAPGADDMAALRAEYQAVVGKRPFLGWGAETLREKIAAAKAEG